MLRATKDGSSITRRLVTKVVAAGLGTSSLATTGAVGESSTEPQDYDRPVPDLEIINNEESARTFNLIGIKKGGKSTFRRSVRVPAESEKSIPAMFTTQAAHILTVIADDDRVATLNTLSSTKIPRRYGIVVNCVDNRLDIWDEHADRQNGGGN